MPVETQKYSKNGNGNLLDLSYFSLKNNNVD